ncbi:helicase-associated domain-containing protein [Streptomyces sp. 4N509B]|uniref:helicase-associated domain-containing protein n=1 Tax=Streptomyces sp. 4N509B TaxID=3457413 RepID=UPI003FD0362F
MTPGTSGRSGSGGGSATTTRTAPRTLADELRARADDELAGLLRHRPDLLSPLPADLSQLATRAGTRASVLRALERLDTFTLQTAEALAVGPQPCPYEELAALLPGADCAERLPHALRTLRRRALLWGPPEAPRLVRTARELLAPAPDRPSSTGLGPTLAEVAGRLSPSRVQQLLTAVGLPATHDSVSAASALAALFTDRERMAALLDEAPPRSRAVLERLTWGPPYGSVPAQPGAELRWLLDRGLLVPHTAGTVVLPREVALHLRGPDGGAHREPRPFPPELTVRAEHTPASADAAAGTAALAALGVVDKLLTAWQTDGPPVLRAGGLGVRDLKRTAVTLDVPEPEAAFWVELAYAAGLLASDGQVDERYAPTPAYDAWLAEPPHRQWLALASAWLATTRVPGLVGGRDAKGRLQAALGPGLDRGPTTEVRRRVLTLLAELPPGTAPEPAAVQRSIRWELPRRMPEELRTLLTGATLVEAEHLGLTGRGALASFARALLPPPASDADADTGTDAGTGAHKGPDTRRGREPGAGAAVPDGQDAQTGEGGQDPHDAQAARHAREARAAELLAPLLPTPLDHFLLQADLTAVAPGPLERELAQVMTLAADVESTGGATVYRFTPGSVRRALDAGWSAAELHTLLAERSRTPVPQPLTYLVDDVARRHGQLRVGAAGSYVRCDDEATLTQVLADRRAESLRLRRIAPTVLVCDAAPDTLLDRLRDLGLAPAAEAADGAVLTLDATTRRTPHRTPPQPAPDASGTDLEPTLLAAAVRAIRAGDHAATAAPPAPAGHRTAEPPSGPPPRTTAAETLTTLQSAARDGSLVWIGYVGADGIAGQRVLAPVRVEGGFVTAFDHTAEEIRTYPLHRITGTHPLHA